MLPLRILAIAVLLVSLLVDTSDLKDVVKPEVQIIFGIAIVAIIMFVDSITGLIFGLTLLLVYLRVYAKMYNIKLDSLVDIQNLLMSDVNKNPNDSTNYPNESLVGINYITPKNLEDAQNNIVDGKASQYVGIQGIYNQGVFGAQGMDDKYPGFVDDLSTSSPAEFKST
jgi:MFS superfamily sulfate permease-like transporter